MVTLSVTLTLMNYFNTECVVFSKVNTVVVLFDQAGCVFKRLRVRLEGLNPKGSLLPSDSHTRPRCHGSEAPLSLAEVEISLFNQTHVPL